MNVTCIHTKDNLPSELISDKYTKFPSNHTYMCMFAIKELQYFSLKFA